jgi:hypothetical protein
MTYTFKLARRLAVSRRFSMLPAILLFAACGGDATAPDGTNTRPLGDWRPREAVPTAVSINPSKVTVETNQLIRFLAHGRNDVGDSVSAPVTWSATGGTILHDGRFSSALLGTFMVTATTTIGDDVRVDTSEVSVVRRRNLVSISISPETSTLAPGVTQSFIATGHLKEGRAVPVGALWTATGGTIDAGGNFTAGDTAGSYLVIASNTTMSVADTAIITITAPVPPPPPPLPAPPTPTLASVTLLPGSATLAPSATRQFRVYGRTTEGDSVAAASVAFAATGGTVTADGLFTAGPTAGTYRVIATSSGLADTSTVTITQPLGSGPGVGVPFGPFNAWSSYTTLKANAEPFNLSHDATTASNIVARITEARKTGRRLSLAIVGGAHTQYLTNGVFDKSKWLARFQTFNTAAIRQAVDQAVSDGTVLIGNVMDEPFHPSWGPSGTLTKARVDSMCADVKAIFPTLPVGPTHDHRNFEPTKSYRVCDYILSQYRYTKGDVQEFRDAGLALARRDGHAIAFSMNIMDGGYRVDGCPVPATGGPGTYEPNCRMTAAQVREYGRVLGPAGCVMLMWRYDDAFMAKPENIQAFRDVAATLATAPRKSCARS